MNKLIKLTMDLCLLALFVSILVIPITGISILRYEKYPAQVLSAQDEQTIDRKALEENREELEMMCREIFSTTAESSESAE